MLTEATHSSYCNSMITPAQISIKVSSKILHNHWSSMNRFLRLSNYSHHVDQVKNEMLQEYRTSTYHIHWTAFTILISQILKSLSSFTTRTKAAWIARSLDSSKHLKTYSCRNSHNSKQNRSNLSRRNKSRRGNWFSNSISWPCSRRNGISRYSQSRICSKFQRT